jgi:hypothetical protein
LGRLYERLRLLNRLIRTLERYRVLREAESRDCRRIRARRV